eukprot:gene861-5486_t
MNEIGDEFQEIITRYKGESWITARRSPDMNPAEHFIALVKIMVWRAVRWQFFYCDDSAFRNRKGKPCHPTVQDIVDAFTYVERYFNKDPKGKETLQNLVHAMTRPTKRHTTGIIQRVIAAKGGHISCIGRRYREEE